MIKFISIHTAVMFVLQSVVSLNMFRLVKHVLELWHGWLLKHFSFVIKLYHET